MNHSSLINRLIKPFVSSSLSCGVSDYHIPLVFSSFTSKLGFYFKNRKNVFHGPLIGMSKQYHEIPPHYIEKHEPRPLSLIIPRERRNIVRERWRNTFKFSREVLGPGIVLFRNYLTLMGQVEIVDMCQKVGGFYQHLDQNGAELGPHMMCFGRNWNPVTRYKKRYRCDGSEPPPLRYNHVLLAESAIQDSNLYLTDQLPSMCPDICLVNFYSASSRLGLHQDNDESSKSLRKGLPVVSISIGDSAEFLYGHTKDENQLEKILLESGDVLIFGGNSRLIFHGVNRILPNSAPESLIQAVGLRPGRLNLTLRQSRL